MGNCKLCMDTGYWIVSKIILYNECYKYRRSILDIISTTLRQSDLVSRHQTVFSKI